MKRIQKTSLTFLLLAATAFGQDTNFAVRLACEMQTAGPASLADLTWQQGTTPHVAVSPLRLGRPIAVDPLTTVKMIIGQSGMVTNYALATNWLATNGVYYVQWPTVGTNSAGTNATAQAWWYTVHFERDGRRYWTGDGRLYIEPTTSTAADGLNWQTITAGAAIDTVAREQIAIVSNMVDNIEVGAVEYGITSNTAYEGNIGHAVSNLARSAYTSAAGAAAVAAAALPASETGAVIAAARANLVAIYDSNGVWNVDMTLGTNQSTRMLVGNGQELVFGDEEVFYQNLNLWSTVMGTNVWDGRVNDTEAARIAALASGSGWTNLAFDGTGNAITGATASTTTLTLQRGTISGTGSSYNFIAGTNVTLTVATTNVTINANPQARSPISTATTATVTGGNAMIYPESNSWWRIPSDSVTNFVISTNGLSSADSTASIGLSIVRTTNTWSWGANVVTNGMAVSIPPANSTSLYMLWIPPSGGAVQGF